MNICFIVEHFSPHIGGVEVAFEEYAKRLSKLGHSIRVITSNSGGITGEKMIQNVKIYYLDCRSFFGHPILPISKIREHIQWADIIHTTTYTAALPTVKVCNKYNKPCILMVHEVLGEKWFVVEKNLVKALGFLFFEWYVIKKRYDIWQTISQATQKDLMQYKIPKKKTRLVYHGIDYTVWNPAVTERKLHTLFNFKPTDRIFLYNGRPGKTKGALLLLEAIKKIQGKIPSNFRFGFILSKNPPNERLEFERLAKSLKLESVIGINDSLPYHELPGYRKNAYAFIVPSLTEGFGFSAAETSALGVPLIVSDAGSLPEVASGKVLFFKNGSSDDLAEKILFAIENKFESIPEKKFDWDKSVKEINQIYQELV